MYTIRSNSCWSNCGCDNLCYQWWHIPSSISNGFISGAISGLASTGSYEFIINAFGLKNKKENDDTKEVIDEENEAEDDTITDESDNSDE